MRFWRDRLGHLISGERAERRDHGLGERRDPEWSTINAR
jgi:hypothetical protein